MRELLIEPVARAPALAYLSASRSLFCIVMPPLADRGFPQKRDGSGGGRRAATERAAVQADRIRRTETKRRTEARARGCGAPRRAYNGARPP